MNTGLCLRSFHVLSLTHPTKTPSSRDNYPLPTRTQSHELCQAHRVLLSKDEVRGLLLESMCFPSAGMILWTSLGSAISPAVVIPHSSLLPDWPQQRPDDGPLSLKSPLISHIPLMTPFADNPSINLPLNICLHTA